MIHWIIQNNLINENDLHQVGQAALRSGATIEEVKVVPFSNELPEFKFSENNVYYGATTFMYNLYRDYKPKGLFFDEDKFQMDNYNLMWGEHMLNYEAIVTTFGEVGSIIKAPDEQMFFIRPNNDDKSFDGKMMSFGDIKDWRSKFINFDNIVLTDETKILIGEPYNVKKEWRLFIVDGKIVSSTLYRKNFMLSKSAIDIPEDMLKFAEERISEYKPHDNFIMDIALCGDAYYIIECGCINSCGFYHADIGKIVSSITDWMKK